MGEVEIDVGWISFAGDRHCLDSVRGREWRDGEGFLLVCLVIAESDGKKRGDLWGERGYTWVW